MLESFLSSKLLYMILFQVDGRYTKNSKYSLFFNPFFTYKEKEKKNKGEKGILKRKISWIYSIPPPRQIKIKECRAISLLKKLSSMTVYNKI